MTTEGVFVGCQVVLDLSTSVGFKKKQEVRKTITNNGGIISYIVTKKVDLKDIIRNNMQKRKDKISPKNIKFYLDIVCPLKLNLYKCWRNKQNVTSELCICVQVVQVVILSDRDIVHIFDEEDNL
ncbi:uncharacterized protein LOC134262286 [Saccostrea cucullata]|uniref:uncharacterized protein LOC134262286 n=1 Tax=Saccostrea cuccullata TaxID=36930 RepID=UPI002ED3556B